MKTSTGCDRGVELLEGGRLPLLAIGGGLLARVRSLGDVLVVDEIMNMRFERIGKR